VGDGCGGVGLEAFVHGPLKVGPGTGGQTFLGDCVRPRLAVVGSAMQTLPMSGVALASETRPVDARNPERSIVARSTALSLVFNYRLASSAFSSDSTGSEIYMRWESHFSIFLLAEGFPFDEEALRLLI